MTPSGVISGSTFNPIFRESNQRTVQYCCSINKKTGGQMAGTFSIGFVAPDKSSLDAEQLS